MTNAREFTNADYDRMSSLGNAARLADLEIERTPLKDVAKLDIANMTAGEIVTLANVMEAVKVLSELFKTEEQGGYGYAPQYPPYARPSTSERRTQSFGDAPAAPTDEEQEALAKLRAYLTERLSETPMVQTVNGPIRVSDVPRDTDGRVDEKWLSANCTCDDHERRRIEADKQEATGIGASGLYL